ncbi:MAG: hypothetical protein ABFE07_11100 [Armatimonadia bacterium]
MGMLNVRLDEDLEKRLAAEVKRRGLRRSDVVRQILDGILPTEEELQAARDRLERIRPFFGSLHSGIPDLAENHSKYLKEIMDAKRADIMGHRSSDQSD